MPKKFRRLGGPWEEFTEPPQKIFISTAEPAHGKESSLVVHVWVLYEVMPTVCLPRKVCVGDASYPYYLSIAVVPALSIAVVPALVSADLSFLSYPACDLAEF